MKLSAPATVLAVFVAASSGAPGAAPAGDSAVAKDTSLHLIVNRKPTSIAIYVALPGAELADRFGGLPPQLAEPEAIVLEDLRTGTVGIVDWMIDRSAARLGGQPATLEPLSAMLHPRDLDLPFRTPRDASTATAVCTAPPGAQAALTDLTLYTGFFLYPVDGTEALDLQLGAMDPGAQLSISSFWDWTEDSQITATVDAAGWVRIPAAQPGHDRLIAAASALGLSLAGIGLLAAAAWRRWGVARKRARA